MGSLNFEGYNIPLHTQSSLERWVDEGIYPGSFLTAVLCNDLFMAVARADSSNSAALVELVKFIYNRVPSDTWGDAETMRKYSHKMYMAKHPEEVVDKV